MCLELSECIYEGANDFCLFELVRASKSCIGFVRLGALETSTMGAAGSEK